MTFLNAILAAGASALVVPLVIHLLHRTRFRTVPWGAMHLLESIVRVNRRRFRIEQLLLLLVRCAIPALLALCLARPVLTGWQTLPGDAPTSMVILLDDSYSMDTVSGARSHLAEAEDEACEILGALGRGSDVSVIETGGGPRPMFDRPLPDPKTVVQQVRLLEGGYGASQMAASLEAGLAILANTAHARRDLVIVSDFQSRDWQDMPPATRQRIRQQIDRLPIRPTMTLLQVGRTVENNVAIEPLELSEQAVGVGQDIAVRVHLRNYGPKTFQDARVLFRVDGEQESVSEVNLPAGASFQTLFTCRFQTAGSHIVDAEVAVDDQLKTDNRSAAVVNVVERMGVLLVDGDPNPEPLKSETDFLAVALSPYALGRVQSPDLMETRTVPVEGLSPEGLAWARVVVLANVSRLSDVQVKMLTEYACGGGCLLVFAGNKMDTEWYNRTLCSAGGMLPMQIESMAGGSADRKESTRIAPQRFEHAALAIFNDQAGGSLSDAEIWKWYRFRDVGRAKTVATPTQVNERDPSEPVVIARLETGDPLAVERRVGEGLVLFVATACDADWSNLPMRPFFLPLMERLVTTMATEATPPSNIEAGNALVAMLPAGLADAALSLTAPDGTRHTVRPVRRGTRSVVQFAQTHRPGVYTLSGPETPPLCFVARAASEESDLHTLDSDELHALAADLGGEVVSSSAEYLERDQARRHGREVWRLLFAAVVGLMFVELVLEQRFTRVRL